MKKRKIEGTRMIISRLKSTRLGEQNKRWWREEITKAEREREEEKGKCRKEEERGETRYYVILRKQKEREKKRKYSKEEGREEMLYNARNGQRIRERSINKNCEGWKN